MITSCAGTSIVTVRRSTLTIRSMNGISRIRPGPRDAGEPAKPEDDAPLVLLHDLDRTQQHDDEEEDDDAQYDQCSPTAMTLS